MRTEAYECTASHGRSVYGESIEKGGAGRLRIGDIDFRAHSFGGKNMAKT